MKEIKNDKEFKKILENDFFVFIGKTKSCGVCDAILKKIIKDIPDDVLVYYAFMEDLDLIRGEYMILSAPSVLIFKEGSEIYREAGFVNVAKIIDKVKQYKN